MRGKSGVRVIDQMSEQPNPFLSASTVLEVNKAKNFLISKGEDPDKVTVNDALKELENTQIPAYYEDETFYRLALMILGSIILVTLVGTIYLAAIAIAIPEGLIAIGSTAVGAFVGLFASSNLSK